jgi:hypothetical protein
LRDVHSVLEGKMPNKSWCYHQVAISFEFEIKFGGYTVVKFLGSGCETWPINNV